MTSKKNNRPCIPRIKICGITRIEDALAAAEAGADALGLVFYPQSLRAVSPKQARTIVDILPPFVTTVGLFVNATPEAVFEVMAQVPLDLLQFHGDERPEYCLQFGRPYLKAVRMKPGTDLASIAADYAGAQGLLLDTYVAGVPGGTGEVFDWRQIPGKVNQPLVLAGGLTPDNVGEAIHSVQPWGVDVSGGVEAAKGIKDPRKIRAFIQACAQSA